MAGPGSFCKAPGAPPGFSAGLHDTTSLGLPPGPPLGPPPEQPPAELPPPPPDFDLDLASLGCYGASLPPGPPPDDFPGFGQFSMPPGPPDCPPVGMPPGMPPCWEPIDGVPPQPPAGLLSVVIGGLRGGLLGGLLGGFPPGFAPAFPSAGPPELGPQPPAFGPDPLHPDAIKAKGPPPGPPPHLAAAAAAEAAAKKKRKAGVEGLASAKNIKSGGSVTVYSGYSAVSAGPHAAQAPQGQAPAPEQRQPGAAAVQGREGLQRQLPDGWEMKRSRTNGRVYYVNEKLGKSQFELPAGSTLKTEVRKKQKLSTRAKDSVDAQLSDRNGVQGLVRATEKRMGRWQKWQQCSKALNEPAPGEEEEEED